MTAYMLSRSAAKPLEGFAWEGKNKLLDLVFNRSTQCGEGVWWDEDACAGAGVNGVRGRGAGCDSRHDLICAEAGPFGGFGATGADACGMSCIVQKIARSSYHHEAQKWNLEQSTNAKRPTHPLPLHSL